MDAVQFHRLVIPLLYLDNDLFKMELITRKKVDELDSMNLS